MIVSMKGRVTAGNKTRYLEQVLYSQKGSKVNNGKMVSSEQ